MEVRVAEATSISFEGRVYLEGEVVEVPDDHPEADRWIRERWVIVEKAAKNPPRRARKSSTTTVLRRKR